MNKPRILLIGDSPNWAFHQIMEFIKENCGHKYDFYTDYMIFHPYAYPARFQRIQSWLQPCRQFFRRLRLGSYRRVLPPDATYDIAVSLGFYMTVLSRMEFRAKRIVKGIYTTSFPSQCVLKGDENIELDDFLNKYFSDADALLVGCRQSLDFYSPHFRTYCANGSCEGLFVRDRAKLPRKESTEGFVVGWTGNPGRSFKGFHDYVIPAVELAAKRCPGMRLKTRFSGPLKTLPRFYDDVDVVLIASIADTGPMMFCEAGFSGVPAVATRVGMPAEVIQHGENGLFVERDVTAMADALIRLYEDRELLKTMSERIVEGITKELGAEIQRTRWETLFDDLLAVRGHSARLSSPRVTSDAA